MCLQTVIDSQVSVPSSGAMLLVKAFVSAPAVLVTSRTLIPLALSEAPCWIMYRPFRVRHTPSDIEGSVSSYTSVPGPMPLLDTVYRHSALARPVMLVCGNTAIGAFSGSGCDEAVI